MLNRLIPTILAYEVDTWAAFSYANFNGRTFTDNVMDVQRSLMTNTALGDDVPIRRGPGSAPSSRTTASPTRASNQVWRADDAAGGAGPGCRAGRPELAMELMRAVAANDEAAVRRRAHMTDDGGDANVKGREHRCTCPLP